MLYKLSWGPYPQVPPSYPALAAQLELRPDHLGRAGPGEEVWALRPSAGQRTQVAHFLHMLTCPTSGLTCVLEGLLSTSLPRSKFLHRTVVGMGKHPQRPVRSGGICVCVSQKWQETAGQI